ncbi:adenosylmethionine--8-amino-7-oxononanoate transaminase [Marinomonas algicola]|uniref:adenosylmethionine--8-amino-7-oxononanoate transaminase n=1 Tax=Marinomonas algicola TaxID=2773454 RepID=UPI001748C924|nr:adenosylmethionine--8-amino-7-oxononanoate transaminase [Marinomonas algicola]
MPQQHTDEALIQLDKELLWHPYTSMSHPAPHFLVKKAQGSRITLSDGKELIDGMSSWWSVIHGYSHPVINNAMKSQIDDFSHVMFGGLTHEPAIKLAEKLSDITPHGLSRVFFSDSGSVSVEVALKMAIQYWHSSGRPNKKKFITPRNGYHGDTFAAMSVCDPINGMHGLFEGALTKQHFIPSPPTGINTPVDEDYLTEVRQIIEKTHLEVAGLIIEPVVQNAGGMRFYNPLYLDRMKLLCEEFDLLLIFDEIATGFGRTGKMFASDHCNISPDIMCVGKALTGGYITLAATITNDKVALGISDKGGVFMHGPTFMGNPLACSAANASLSLLSSYDLTSRIQTIESKLTESLKRCRSLANVADVRCLGAIGVVELTSPVNQQQIQPLFVEQGVWVRPFGKLIYLMPPYIISNEDLETLGNAIYNVTKSLAYNTKN